ncbi:MAG: sensor histidine kinase [Bacteroidales bacterium]|nr:sensor histidine kinase [Bacteroidales bacterium]
MMKKLFFTMLLFISASSATAGVHTDDPYVRHSIDSLKQLLNTQPYTERQRMEVYCEIGNWYHSCDADSAIHYSNKAIVIAQKLKDHEMLMRIFDNLGVVYCFKGDCERAFSYFNQQQELAIRHGNKRMEWRAIRSIAYTYAKQGKFNTAMDYYLKALDFFENEGWTNDDKYITTLTNLSEINRRLGNTETAIRYLQQAEKTHNELYDDPYQHTWTFAHICNEYAFNYLKQNNLEEAFRYASKMGGDNVYSGQVNRCYAKGLLATIYLKKNNLDSALHYAKASYRQAEVLKDISLYAYSGKILSDVYLAQKRYREAEAEALKAWESSATYVDDLQNLVENIALANIYMGNTEKAAYYLKKYSELNAQYSEKSFHTTVSDLSIKYETEKKEMRIAALEEKEQLYIELGSVIAVIMLLAIVLLIVRHRIKRKLAEQRVKQLEQEQQLIATQAVLDGETAERSRLARDLHDGLGGMLSVVKLNLKDMNHYAIMDGSDVERYGKALDMLDQSIGELRRVAHHIMPESLMRYGLKTALEDFCQAVPGAHFQYLGENPRLDNRLEVLVYRCAYELVNNAVKHAQSTAINVQLMIDNGLVSLTVHDDGVGFDAQTVKSGIGLENIHARLAMYNGKMTIYSSPNKGTEVSVEIEQAEQ